MKKLIVLSMCLLMVSLTGCGGKKYTYDVDWEADLSQPIDLVALYPEESSSVFGKDDTAQIITDVTGYNVEYQNVSDATADNEINSILTTQKKYHMLKLTEAQYHPYMANGTFLDLTEILEKTEAGRKIYDIIDLMDYGWDAVTYTDENGQNHIYGIPDFGYCMMEDSALVWNVDHLIKIGYVNEDGSVKVPSTMEEFNDACTKLQAMFGGNASYHAMDLSGNVLVNPIQGAFEVPWEFYLDSDGNIKQYIYSEATEKYVEYMAGLQQAGILSSAWDQSSSAAACTNFASELCSVAYLQYWYVEAFVNTIVSKGIIAENLGLNNEYRVVHDEAIVWNTRLLGDGTGGSVVQEKARLQGGADGVSYYTVIPNYMAEDALHIIDFLAKKLENFDAFYGGQEGVHWNKVEAPEGAEDYYEDGNYDYQQYEIYQGADSVIYLRPYEYTYRIGEAKEDGTYDTKTVNGGGCWVQLTQRYIDQIVDNSQYCNGTNAVVANVLFHLRETGFDAWQVTVPVDETLITNPMSMSPPMEYWAPVSILSRTVAKRGITSAIKADNSISALNITRDSLKEKSVKKNGVTYYYWSDDIMNEMTTWYNDVKLNRQ